MRELIANIMDIVSEQKVSLTDRPAAVALLVAEAVGNTLAIPTSPVTDPTGYFRNMHQGQLNHMLDEINKICVIDIDEVESVVHKLWLTRYRLVHQPDSPRVQQLFKMLIETGCPDIPARYTNLTQQYRGLYANNYVMSAIVEKDSSVEEAHDA